MPKMPLIAIKDLVITINGRKVLDIPELTIERGEQLALIGPNGAGKSTLLLAIASLIKADRGNILFDGKIVGKDYPVIDYRRRLAIVFQEPLLLNTTVYENVATGLKLRGMRGEVIRERVLAVLEMFGIAHLKDRKAKHLSGGEAQRTSLARAFAVDPDILLLDEPFSSLDEPTRQKLIDDLEKILKDTKTTTLFATHDRLEALRLATGMAVIKEGEIVQIGSPEEVMNYPKDEFVANFVGVEAILSGIVVAKNGGSFLAKVADKEIEAVGDFKVGERVILCIRPENVVISIKENTGETSSRNIFKARIEKIMPYGFYFKLQLNCGFPLSAYITKHSLEALALKEGSDVFASFKATAVHVIHKPL